MSNDPVAVVNRQFEEVINAHRPDLADEVFHPELRVLRTGMQGAVQYLADRGFSHVGGPGGATVPPTNPIDGFKFGQTTIVAAFPDMHLEILEQFAQGDRVVTRLMFRGTHKGEFIGLAPTHRKVEFEEILLMKVTDGKISEVWALGDSLAFLDQLGVLAGPET
ncbi:MULTISPECIES: ester cyclase [Streptomyces]|uniref:ester cyclase n=1 Tax=Streptomyces lycopersici TaxID=2974589 RepID=UPI0021D0F659|nr:ester cyclase [Streptomyces sp. NEAU-383]